MAIADNLVLKVQPAAGDTYIKNLVTVEDVAASGAGTIALDNDAGLYGWHITGVRQGVFTGGVAYEGSTTTFAVRMKLNARAANFAIYLMLLNNAVAGSGFGPNISNNGSSTGTLNLRESIGGSGFNVIGAPAYVTGQYITIVMRFSEGGAGTGLLEVFLKQASRVNNDPDFSVVAPSKTSGTSGVLQNLFFGSAGTDLTVVDMGSWTAGKTNAECAALADDIRTAINAVPPTVNLTASALSGGATIDTATVTVTPAESGVVNLAGSSMSGGSTVSTATVTVTPVQGTLTSGVFLAWGSPAPLAGLTIPRVVVLKMSDGSTVLNLADQVTNGAGRIVLTNAAIVAGTWYMLPTWDADGANCGNKAFLAT